MLTRVVPVTPPNTNVEFYAMGVTGCVPVDIAIK
jgi:hypothetical protein